MMHGGNLQAAKERYGLESFIDLSANINPFGPPNGVWDVLRNCQEKVIHYPDPESSNLRQLMAEKYNLEKEQILLGNGAGELIFLTMFALRPNKVLIPEPAFSEYERSALALGAEIKRIHMGERGWDSQDLSDQKILAQWEEGLKECDLFFLNSPHNPTGSALTREQFSILLQLAQKYQTMVVLDESFVDFLEEEKRWTGREYLHFKNLLVLYSLTKFYAIPGLRLGAIFANCTILNELKKYRDPWSVNALAQEAGILVLGDDEYASKVRKLLQESKEEFYADFEKAKFHKLHLYPSTVNFALLSLRGVQSQVEKIELLQQLGQQGILLRDCSNFRGLERGYLRTAIKDNSSMDTLIKVLKTWDK